MAIAFHNADVKFVLKNKKELRLFIGEMVNKNGFILGDLSFVFCSDDYLLDINRRFLNHDYYTDIITFPLNEKEKHIIGEIYISTDRVKDNAAKFSESKITAAIEQQSIQTELHRVIFHGVLHLLGYKDKTKVHQAEMRKMEDLWLKRYKVFLTET